MALGPRRKNSHSLTKMALGPRRKNSHSLTKMALGPRRKNSHSLTKYEMALFAHSYVTARDGDHAITVESAAGWCPLGCRAKEG